MLKRRIGLAVSPGPMTEAGKMQETHVEKAKRSENLVVVAMLSE